MLKLLFIIWFVLILVFIGLLALPIYVYVHMTNSFNWEKIKRFYWKWLRM